MTTGAHFGCPKFTFDRISGHLKLIFLIFFYKMAGGAHFGCPKFTFDRNFFEIFDIMAAVGHFGCPKFTFDLISDHFRSMHNFSFFELFDKMAAVGHFGCLKFTFDRISGHFRSIRIFFFFDFFFTKWPPADILDVRKSVLIAFLAISDWSAILDV